LQEHLPEPAVGVEAHPRRLEVDEHLHALHGAQPVSEAIFSLVGDDGQAGVGLRGDGERPHIAWWDSHLRITTVTIGHELEHHRVAPLRRDEDGVLGPPPTISHLLDSREVGREPGLRVDRFVGDRDDTPAGLLGRGGGIVGAGAAHHEEGGGDNDDQAVHGISLAIEKVVWENTLEN